VDKKINRTRNFKGSLTVMKRYYSRRWRQQCKESVTASVHCLVADAPLRAPMRATGSVAAPAGTAC
jgi:hypothetical protein